MRPSPLFEEAIRLDAALGNGWLGRGLCHIRRGEIESGRQDLLVAAALEPQRALLRSYLGKAFSLEGEWLLGRRELDLAKRLDPRDPTAWLYLALLDQQENRVNEGVRDLEKSKRPERPAKSVSFAVVVGSGPRSAQRQFGCPLSRCRPGAVQLG